jgi:general stress protein 26
MLDLRRRILDVVNKGPILSAFSTITIDEKPWVRYVVAEASSDLVFRFTSFNSARKIDQIARNPECHLTCGIPSAQEFHMPYLQVQGHARYKTDKDTRRVFWSERLRVLFDGPDDPRYGVVELLPYRIEYTRVGLATEIWTQDVSDIGQVSAKWHEAHRI